MSYFSVIQCALTIHRDQINMADVQAYKKGYNELIDNVKRIDGEQRELNQHNTMVSAKIAPLAKNLELKMKKRATLKSQIEKRINEMVNLPSVQDEKMVSDFRPRYGTISELHKRTLSRSISRKRNRRSNNLSINPPNCPRNWPKTMRESTISRSRKVKF